MTRKPRVSKPPVSKPRVSKPTRSQPQKRSDSATAPITPPISEIEASNLSLHQLFEQQAAEMLERADLDEEQRQSILLAMSCPCCGASGPSFSFKLKRRT
jgi:hypothetical protein